MFCQELLKQMFLKRLYNVCYALYSKVASTNFSALAIKLLIAKFKCCLSRTQEKSY